MTDWNSAHAKNSSAMVARHAGHAVVGRRDTLVQTISATATTLALQTQQQIYQQQHQQSTIYHNK
jgi:hypothetical protein